MRPLQEIEVALAEPLRSEDTQLRDGPGGKPQEYVGEAEMAHRLNLSVGPLSWWHTIESVEIMAEVEGKKTHFKTGVPMPVWSIMARAIGSLTIEYLDQAGARRTTTRRDIGCSTAQNYPSRLDAMEMAQKAAATDSWKRCARYLGPKFGLFLRTRFDPERREAMTQEGLDRAVAGVTATPADDGPFSDTPVLEQLVATTERVVTDPAAPALDILEQLLPDWLFIDLKARLKTTPIEPLPQNILVEFDKALKDVAGPASKALWQSVGVTPKPGIKLTVATLIAIGEHIYQASGGNLEAWYESVSGKAPAATNGNGADLEKSLLENIGPACLDTIRSLRDLPDDGKDLEVARTVNAIARARLSKNNKQDESYKMWADVGVKTGETPTNGQVKKFALSIPKEIKA
jgi:hypothetical protein